MSRRSARPNLSNASQSSSNQKAPNNHAKTTYSKTPNSRRYSVVETAIEEEEEGETNDEGVVTASRDPSISSTTTVTTVCNATPAAAPISPIDGSDLTPAVSGADAISSPSNFQSRVRCSTASETPALSDGQVDQFSTSPKKPLRSYSSPDGVVDSRLKTLDWKNGDMWVHVYQQKQENIENLRRRISRSESIDSDVGSSIGSDAGSTGSSGRGKRERSSFYQPHEQAAIATSVINTLRALKQSNMEGTAEATDAAVKETDSGFHPDSETVLAPQCQDSDVAFISKPVPTAIPGQQSTQFTYPPSSLANAHSLTTLTAEQISQLQASIACASLVPPSMVIGGGSDHSPQSVFSHAPSVSESRNPTRPSSNVASARSTPPQNRSQHQQPQQPQPQQLFAANVFTPVMLSMSKASSRRVSSSSSEEDDDDEYKSEVLEESPCKRWQKRKETVMQNDIPGCDGSYLAMDSEEGFEVVWSELLFSERKKFKDQQEKIASIFDHLIQLDHPNIMKFHNFWMDNENTEQPRVIFIKEYMSSGSLAHFMRKSRMNKKKLQLRSWRRWSSEILSALSYLHDTRSRWDGDNGIIHGNLSCDTVFIQQNGTIKIGSVSLEAINHHVKTCRDQIDHRYFAPEYAAIDSNQRQYLTTAVDIYAFGVLALVMASAIQWPTENIGGSGSGSGHRSTDEDGGNENPHSAVELNESKLEASLGNDLQAAIERLENPLQRDFLRLCLLPSPKSRATAKELLAHPALIEGEANSLLVLASSAAFEAIKGDSGSNDTDSVADFGLKIKTLLPPWDAVYASSSLHPQLSYIDYAVIDLTDFAAKLISSSPSSSSSSEKSVEDKEADYSASVSPLRTLLRMRRRRYGCGGTVGPARAGNAGAAAAACSTGSNAEVGITNAHLMGVGGSEGCVGGDANGKSGAGGGDGGAAWAASSNPDDDAMERDSMCDDNGGGGGVLGFDSADGTWEPETRTILQMSCSIQEKVDQKGGDLWKLTLLFRLSDKMNRQLTATIGSPVDNAPLLVEELVHFGFIAAEDQVRVTDFLAQNIQNIQNRTANHRHSSVDSFVLEDPHLAPAK